jgi:hypothetical protein
VIAATVAVHTANRDGGVESNFKEFMLKRLQQPTPRDCIAAWSEHLPRQDHAYLTFVQKPPDLKGKCKERNIAEQHVASIQGPRSIHQYYRSRHYADDNFIWIKHWEYVTLVAHITKTELRIPSLL